MKDKKSKTIDAKVESKKVEENKAGENKSYTKWMLLVVVTILVFGFVGYKYLLDFSDEVKTKVVIRKAPEASIKAASKALEPENFVAEIQSNKPVEIIKEVQEVISQAEPEIASQTDLFQNAIGAISSQEIVSSAADDDALSDIIKKQESTIIYLAAKDLARSEGELEFQDSLDFLEDAAANEPTIQSKVNLLRIATKDGLLDTDELLEEFAIRADDLEESSEKDVWESVKSSVGELVKVTNLQSSNGGGYALYKQAEFALEGDDYAKAVEIAQELGAEDLTLEIKNLQRISETVDYILDYSKNKLVE